MVRLWSVVRSSRRNSFPRQDFSTGFVPTKLSYTIDFVPLCNVSSLNILNYLHKFSKSSIFSFNSYYNSSSNSSHSIKKTVTVFLKLLKKKQCAETDSVSSKSRRTSIVHFVRYY